MGDAEVIPLGTRGRPGRGTGSARPSSAARNLAGPAARKKAAPRPTPAPEPAPVAEEGIPEQPAPHVVPEAPRVESVAERRPAGGIPVGDWLEALGGAAREVFGDRWEPRLAEFLAFLRRRVTGDFEVDEYGFDAEVTERFLLAAVRPIAQKWFRVEVRGAENIPAEGGALAPAS